MVWEQILRINKKRVIPLVPQNSYAFLSFIRRAYRLCSDNQVDKESNFIKKFSLEHGFWVPTSIG